MYADLERTLAGRYGRELADLSAARAEIQAEREEALEALGDAGEKLIELQARIAELDEELATLRQRERIQSELRWQDTKVQERTAARVAELEAHQVELERKLAASQAREKLTSERAEKLLDEMAEERRLLEAQREELGEARGQLKAQEYRIHELCRALEQEQAKRFVLEAKLERGVQVLAGGVDEVSHTSNGAAPPPTRSRYPSPKKIGKAKASTTPAADRAAAVSDLAVKDQAASS
jgi:chromosome segregation ATPase